jgi:single-strand DNA-binding protein
MNIIHILGRIVNDPEFKMTQSGISMCNFRIAVDKKYPKPDDKEKSNFFSVITWRKNAEIC